ncbi:uncharacterized protein LOC126322566 [Schistocerca gregaria]|uniref:uncharacterized protein LOC126322566 n=1 Tax=Schistocerca gregaria TaxID=7010 RepID=UPI00211DD703|nr:uncharacterized protein LOC126322566 [Schistocerca gregaria]
MFNFSPFVQMHFREQLEPSNNMPFDTFLKVVEQEIDENKKLEQPTLQTKNSEFKKEESSTEAFVQNSIDAKHDLSDSSTSSFSNSSTPSLSSNDDSLNDYPTIPTINGLKKRFTMFTPEMHHVEKENADQNVVLPLTSTCQHVASNDAEILRGGAREACSTKSPGSLTESSIRSPRLSMQQLLTEPSMRLSRESEVVSPMMRTLQGDRLTVDRASSTNLPRHSSPFVTPARTSLKDDDPKLKLTKVSIDRSMAQSGNSEFRHQLYELGLKKDKEHTHCSSIPLFPSVISLVLAKLERLERNIDLKPSPNLACLHSNNFAVSTRGTRNRENCTRDVPDASLETPLTCPSNVLFSPLPQQKRRARQDADWSFAEVYRDEWKSRTPSQGSLNKLTNQVDLKVLHNALVLAKNQSLNQAHLALFSALKIPLEYKQDSSQIKNKIDVKLRELWTANPDLQFYSEKKEFTLKRLMKVPEVLLVRGSTELMERFRDNK